MEMADNSFGIQIKIIIMLAHNYDE